MNVLQLAWRYLRARPLGTLLNVLLLALGVATIGFVRIVDGGIADSLQRNVRGIDLVVGAKGSPMQLILAGIFHLDAPTGNIPLQAAADLARDPQVRAVIPLSLGDSVGGFRIVGTTPDYVPLYAGTYAAGSGWNAPMQAVLGAAVAAQTGLRTGATFAGTHGLGAGGAAHAAAGYTVTGVLQPTGSVLDRLVLVDLESVWRVHAAHPPPAEAAGASGPQDLAHDDREVTLLLIRYATPLAAVSLPRRINAGTALQAASPAQESARLFRMIGAGADVIRAFGAVVLATAALSLFIALYHALNERSYDIAVLRTLGARPATIAVMLMAEALLLALAGGLVGLLLAHGLVGLLVLWLPVQDSLALSGRVFATGELWLLVPALVAAALAALLPCWRAAHADISATLARRH